MAMLFSVMSFAAEVTVKISDYATTNGWKDATQYKTLKMDDNVSITVAGSSNTGKYYTNGNNWRMYQNESPKITLTATNGNLLKTVKFTYAAEKTGILVDASKAQVKSGTVYTFADEVTTYTFGVGNTGTATNGQVRFTEITVVYDAPTPSDPDAVKYTVTAKVNDPAMGTVSGAGEIEEGKTATLTANANAGYKFVNWSNGSTDNPLKITVTENVEITANFEVIPTMTCAEAAAAPKDAVVVLNPFDVVYVVKGAGYIYIKDESGVALIYDFNLDDQLKAGDHVEGFVGTSSPFNGLPEIKPTVSFADLKVTPGTAPEATVFETVPTKEDVNKYVVFKGVKLTSNISYNTSSATNATISVGGKNVTLRNTFKLAASLTSGSTYDIYAFVAIYNGNIQMYYASSVDVSPERTITATVNPAETGTVTGAGTYKEGKTATLKATPAEGYAFTCWTEGEDTVSTAANYSFKVAADRALVANFAKKTYNVTVTAENGTVTGVGEYEENAEATLTATANEGYEFTCWTSGEDTVSTANPYTFAVTANVALVANFKEVVVEEPVEAKLYLTPNANWKQSNARFAAYFFDNGETWVGMTKVAGETDLYEVTIPTDKKYPKVIFCRMNPSAAANNWNNKWNQTADLVIPTDGKNHYTVKAGTWDKGGGTWSIWPVPTVKTYVDITITVTANAPASIKWANAGDKLADATEYVAMTAGENNTYTYTLAQVDELKGVDYTVKVGEAVSATQNTSKNVTVDFKALLPQVAVQGVNNWDGTDKMTIADDYLTASITLPLVAKKYDLKLTLDATWKGTTSNNITRENNSSAFTGDSGNGSITADIAGDYVFTYTYATQTLTVTYPALLVKYNVTVTAENGTVEGAGEYEENAEATLTATAAEGYEFVNWTVGDSIVSTENPYKFTVTADLALVANFKEVVKAIEVNVTDATATSGEWSIDLAGSWNDQALTIKLWQDNTQGFGSYAPNTETGYYILLGAKELTPTTAGVYADNGDGTFTFTCSATDGTTQYNITVTGTSGAQEVYYETFVLTNLEVTDNETFLVLSASDMTMGLEVTLGVNTADATLMDASKILFGGEVLPILSSEPVTVTFNEELLTDVYTARVVVEHMGQQLGLELIMYAGTSSKEPVTIAVTGAVASVANDGWLVINGTWNELPFMLKVAGYEDTPFKEYTGIQVGEMEYGVWEQTDADFGFSDLVTVIKTGDNLDVMGEFTSIATGTTYNVSVSASFAAGPETGVDNINTTVAPVKVIENGQIFIISNGVKYNAQGAQL